MNKRPPEPEALVFALLGTAHAVEARLEAALAPLGLSVAMLGVLRLLAEAPEPLTLGELAQHQQCVRSNVTQMIDRLEKDGLVRRHPSPTDRRSIRASLTPAGVRAHASGMAAFAEAQQAIVAEMSTEDADTLQTVLGLLSKHS